MVNYLVLLELLQLPLVLVPLVDAGGPEDWTAQREWNRSVSERMDKSEVAFRELRGMVETSNTRLDSSEAMHEQTKARVQRSEVDVRELRGMVDRLVSEIDALVKVQLNIDK